MKKKIWILLLCCALVSGLVPTVNINAYAQEPEQTLLVYQDGEAVTEAALPVSQKITLQANAYPEDFAAQSYQWQIQVPSGVWVDIAGEAQKTINLTYGMVASLLDSDSAVQVRCKLIDDSVGAMLSNEVRVTVDSSQPLPELPLENGTVLREAEAVANPAPAQDENPAQNETPAASDKDQTAPAPADNADSDTSAPSTEPQAPTGDTDNTANAGTSADTNANADTVADTNANADTVADTNANADAATGANANADAATDANANADAPAASEDQAAAPAADADAPAADADTKPAASADTPAGEPAPAPANAANAPADDLNNAKADLGSSPSDVMDALPTPVDALDQIKSTLKDAAAALADETGETETFNIIINYVFENGTQAANPWTANIAKGSSYNQTITSPTVLGYAPDRATVEVVIENIQKDETYTVTYKPAKVNLTVKHYQQNINDDKYTLADTETKEGYTASEVGEDLSKKYDGFYALLYNTTTEIAADGSTVVEIYYDRYYYLMNFDLDGGYGVEPIYARYGSQIEVGTPIKAGCTFEEWEPALPNTMPIGGGTYKASWIKGKADLTVVFWYENADDNNYSYAGAATIKDLDVESQQSSGDYKEVDFDKRDDEHFTYNASKAENVTVAGDGSSVLNVYYTRNKYTLTFRELTCNNFLPWHSHNDDCYTTRATITAKYDAKISGEFSKAPFNTTYNGRAWECTESSKYDYALQTLDRMPGFDATFNLYDKNSDDKKIIYYHVQKVGTTVNTSQWPNDSTNFELLKQVDTYFNYATYEEEYHTIQGFQRYKKRISFNETYRTAEDVKNFKNGKLNLYYIRESHNLNFYNRDGFVSEKKQSVQYEAPLKSYNFIPDYPSGLEPNAYVFAGWYTSPGCYDGSEVDWNTITMPAGDLTLYAKWTPKTHTVKTWLTDEMKTPVNVGESESNEQKVPHGSNAVAPETPNNGNYTFIGWFYKDDNGVEKAFNFSMPVNRDLNLYAKWSSNTLVTYTIHYQLKDGTTIAPDTTGSALANSTKTFDAKAGSELKAGYQTGYFPETNSHSLTMDIEGENEFTFIYVPKEKVAYTVRYLEKGTNNVLHDEKHGVTRDAVITEKFEQVNGYAPDAYQKRLVLSANEEENVIIFWYIKDEIHAPVQIIHWTQNIAGDGYTEYRSSTNLNGEIGKTYTEESLTIPGFNYNETKSNASGELTAAGLVLNLYYDRIEYPYEFRFLEQGTDKVLVASVTGSARYQAQVTQQAKDIPGYTLVSDENQEINIAIEDLADVANKNVRTFYYQENEVNIAYVVVDPGSGTVSRAAETVKVISGTAQGSTPTANPGYRFVGWFKDENCSASVDAGWVNNDDKKLTPQKEAGLYKTATYYAKFERALADLTITKSGWNSIDENQSFIFRIKGTDDNTKHIDIRVVIHGTGSVTIKDLPVGNYEVTEETDWSWRYTPDTNPKTVNLMTDTELPFHNTRTNDKWLNGNAFCDNRWMNGSQNKSN